MKEYLEEKVGAALRKLGHPEAIRPMFERPKLEAHGDLTTNIAMVLAKTAGKNPRAVAQEIMSAL